MYEKYAGIGKKEFNHNLDSVVRLNVSDELWKKIAVAAQSAGFRYTLDLFAAESNRS